MGEFYLGMTCRGLNCWTFFGGMVVSFVHGGDDFTHLGGSFCLQSRLLEGQRLLLPQDLYVAYN